MIFKKILKGVIFFLFVVAIPTAVFSSAPKQMTVVITSDKSNVLYDGKILSDPSVSKYEKTITINPSKGTKSINIQIKGFAAKVFFKNCPSGKKIKLIFDVMSKNSTCILPFVKLPNTCQPTEICT